MTDFGIEPGPKNLGPVVCLVICVIERELTTEAIVRAALLAGAYVPDTDDPDQNMFLLRFPFHPQILCNYLGAEGILGKLKALDISGCA